MTRAQYELLVKVGFIDGKVSENSDDEVAGPSVEDK
jgi:hypothetical protein